MVRQNTAEQERQLTNIVRLGTIAEVDCDKALARVTSGGITTDWLPWLTQRAGTTISWNPPTIGEQCIVLASSGELTTAVILLGLYTSNAPSKNPDEWLFYFPDGATLMYNHSSGHFALKNCKTAEVFASQSVTADTPHFICTGDVTIKGNLKVEKAINATGNIRTTQSVTASAGMNSISGDVKAGSISLKYHTHQEQGDGKETSNAH
ncbi:phage baseplate assembly protein V [Actinobacillus equuli subsp. equuli]|uniref:Phage baseplate assembly protein V n=1 Tax=Actinobacillus equuli subsp. equuli TaxID=202947 RepID=A0A9X4G3J3_ACTEU|nr:phage baseplate assembly protein V [Actinobacillus equuli]MDE8034643.1 phage baseplate assembly protein V [Actinobacillus equuli subsp. equuli]